MTSPETAMGGLADRVEAATGPDPDLQYDVMTAYGYRDIYGDRLLFDKGNDGYWTMWEPEGVAPLPDPLSSLDAAMTLVPLGHAFTVGQNVHHRHWVASVNYLDHDGAPATRGCSNASATAALALTAACLRARAALANTTGEAQ